MPALRVFETVLVALTGGLTRRVFRGFASYATTGGASENSSRTGMVSGYMPGIDDRDFTDSERFRTRVWTQAITQCLDREHMTVRDLRQGRNPCTDCTADALFALEY